MIEEDANGIRKKRHRRTSLAIEKDIMDATKQLIEEVGFSNITLTGVAQRARIEPNVFYKRFKDLDELFEKFTERYDYWFSDILSNYKIDELNLTNCKDIFIKVIQDLISAIYRNKSMQKLLVWELSEDNSIISRTARLREVNSNQFIIYYQKIFKKRNVNFNALTALVIGGIYYLILHREKSTFCGINFNTRLGKETLQDLIQYLFDKVFDDLCPSKESIRIAINLKKNFVDDDVIARSTGLTIEEVKQL